MAACRRGLALTALLMALCIAAARAQDPAAAAGANATAPAAAGVANATADPAAAPVSPAAAAAAPAVPPGTDAAANGTAPAGGLPPAGAVPAPGADAANATGAAPDAAANATDAATAAPADANTTATAAAANATAAAPDAAASATNATAAAPDAAAAAASNATAAPDAAAAAGNSTAADAGNGTITIGLPPAVMPAAAAAPKPVAATKANGTAAPKPKPKAGAAPKATPFLPVASAPLIGMAPAPRPTPKPAAGSKPAAGTKSAAGAKPAAGVKPRPKPQAAVDVEPAPAAQAAPKKPKAPAAPVASPPAKKHTAGKKDSKGAKVGQKLHIGCIVPLTGPKKNTGEAIKAAMEMAIADYAPKRLPGVTVTLACEDTKCSDIPALWGGQKLAKEGVDAMVGEVCSSASLGALGVINKYRVPLISPASTSPALSIAGDYFFRTVPSDHYQGQFAAKQVLDAGVKKVVVAATSDSYGEELAYSFIAAFTAKGGEVSTVELPVHVKGKKADPVVTAIKKHGANGVFIATNDLFWAADIIKAIRAAKLPVRIFGGDSIMDATVPERAGKATVAGVQGSDVSFGSPEFVKAFKEFTKGRGIEYVAKAAHAYDAAWALMEAYRRAAEPKKGPEIVAELQHVKFPGKSGPVAFNEEGDLVPTPGSYVMTTFAKDGAVKVVQTKA